MVGEYCAPDVDSIIRNKSVKQKYQNSFIQILSFWLSILKSFRLTKKPFENRDLFFAHYSSRQKDWSILNGTERQLDGIASIFRFEASTYVRQYSLVDLYNWLIRVISFTIRLRRLFRRLTKAGIINRSAARVLRHFIITHALFVENVTQQLKKNGPKHILSTHDRNRYNAILISVANGLGVSTSVLIHGSSFHLPTGYVLPIAKTALLWGPLQSRVFQEYGLSSERVRIVGFPNLGYKKSQDVAELKKHYQLQVDKKVLLLASQPSAFDSEVIRYVSNEVETLSDWLVLIKLHPTSYSKRLPEIPINKNVRVLPEKCTTLESLSMADVTAGLASTLLIESVSMGTPVIVINPTSEHEEGVGGLFVQHGGAKYCSKENELLDVLRSAESKDLGSVLNNNKQLEFFDKLCAYRGAESEGQILHFLNETVQNN